MGKGKKAPEILAPAGSVEAVTAAVAAGCDAVYIGGSRFGARTLKKALTREDLLFAIDYCHLFGVKIYLTVNTLLTEGEITDFLPAFLNPLVRAGLDAVIVQDFGVLEFIRQEFPGLCVHASTQINIVSGQGLFVFESSPVKRIVPARELTLSELQRMRTETSLEMEVFVHGALCYCYSGQCLFSSMSGRRSGNRGRCAQPCRKPYNDSYLLSLKELCALPHLPELIDMGIDSFKIEGRGKNAAYTALVTSIYRKHTDLYLALGGFGYRDYLEKNSASYAEDLRCLAEIYNREGFTAGYLEGEAKNSCLSSKKRGQMLAASRARHGGVLVGKVIDSQKTQVSYRLDRAVSAQDVVEFRDGAAKTVYEYTIKEGAFSRQIVRANVDRKKKISPGDLVYRTKDAALLKKIREEFLTAKIKLPVTGKFVAAENEALYLCLQTKTGGKLFTAACRGSLCQTAKTAPITEESVRKALSQTGESPFYFKDLSVEINGKVFVTVSACKQLRREALERLTDEILTSYKKTGKKRIGQTKKDATTAAPAKDFFPARENDKKGKEKTPQITASVLTSNQINTVLSFPFIDAVYLRTELMGAPVLSETAKRVRQNGKKVFLEMPMIFRPDTEKIFSRAIGKEGEIFGTTWDGFLVKNIESLQFLIRRCRVSFSDIRLDFSLYVTNSYANRFWQKKGIENFTVPLELEKEKMKDLPNLSCAELLVYGKVPLMVSAQCMRANTDCGKKDREKQGEPLRFTDEKKREFEALNCCKFCYNIIMSREPLFLSDSARKGLSASSLRYMFTTESESDVADVLSFRMTQKTNTGRFFDGAE